jgi:hypothetical protein
MQSSPPRQLLLSLPPRQFSPSLKPLPQPSLVPLFAERTRGGADKAPRKPLALMQSSLLRQL